jgi:hypothetical protein
LRLLPSNLPVRRQQFLKPPPGATRTQVVAAEFFYEFFFAVNDLRPALYFAFGRISLPALTAALKRSVPRNSFRFA